MNPSAKKPSLLSRYATKLGLAITKPFSKKVKYDFRTDAEKAAEKDPKSPKYKKNGVDKLVDRMLSPY